MLLFNIARLFAKLIIKMYESYSFYIIEGLKEITLGVICLWQVYLMVM